MNTSSITSKASDETMMSFLGLGSVAENTQIVDSVYKTHTKFSVVRNDIYWVVVDKNVYHNPYGPSIVSFYTNNKIKKICYHLYGNLHRANEPAEIIYNDNGMIVRECYWINNKLHNSTGPAFRDYCYNRWRNFFYKNGISITKEKFLNMIHI